MLVNKKRRDLSLLLFSLPLIPALLKIDFIYNFSQKDIVNKGGWLLSTSDK